MIKELILKAILAVISLLIATQGFSQSAKQLEQYVNKIDTAFQTSN